MRLFIALDIDDVIRERITRFMDGVSRFAPDARWVAPESLHVTLKFVGEQQDGSIDRIRIALQSVAACTTEIRFRGHGFFPTAKSARVFWIGMDASPQLGALAAAIDDVTAALGIPKEDRAFSPHLTLARSRGGSGAPRSLTTDKPNRAFEQLQETLASRPTPEFGTMTPREFFLYQSRLSPKGSKYTKLAAFDLKVAPI
jgi:2'-5' RNA ligase